MYRILLDVVHSYCYFLAKSYSGSSTTPLREFISYVHIIHRGLRSDIIFSHVWGYEDCSSWFNEGKKNCIYTTKNVSRIGWLSTLKSCLSTWIACFSIRSDWKEEKHLTPLLRQWFKELWHWTGSRRGIGAQDSSECYCTWICANTLRGFSRSQWRSCKPPNWLRVVLLHLVF